MLIEIQLILGNYMLVEIEFEWCEWIQSKIESEKKTEKYRIDGPCTRWQWQFQLKRILTICITVKYFFHHKCFCTCGPIAANI